MYSAMIIHDWYCLKAVFVIQNSSDFRAKWFNDNFMHANPSEVNLIIFGGNSLQTGAIRTNDHVNIELRSTAKLLRWGAS